MEGGEDAAGIARFAGAKSGSATVTSLSCAAVGYKSGKGTCTLSRKQLKPNYSYSFEGTYMGAASFASSASNAESVGVDK